jgi:hypothetical protein
VSAAVDGFCGGCCGEQLLASSFSFQLLQADVSAIKAEAAAPFPSEPLLTLLTPAYFLRPKSHACPDRVVAASDSGS